MNSIDKDKIIQILKKRFLYLVVIVIGLGLVVYGSLSSDTDCLEVAFGILSGSLTALIASTTLGTAKDEDAGIDDWLSLLDSIARDQARQQDSETELFRGEGSEQKSINDLILSARKRIWILGANFTNALIHHKDAIMSCAASGESIDIRLLSCHPNNLFLFTRYHEIPGKSHSAMIRETYEANQSLIALKRDILAINPSVRFETRFYLLQPTVLLMIIDDDIVISHPLVNASASNNVRLRFKPQNADSMFIGHFLTSWDNAEEKSEYIERERMPKLSRNGEKIYEYSVVLHYTALRSFFIKIKNHSRACLSFLGKHAKTLYAPLLFLVLSLIGYLSLRRADPSAILLYNNLSSSVLGVFSGAVLSIIEYAFDHHNTKREADDLKARQKQVDEQLGRSLKKNFFKDSLGQQGIQVFHNRNAAQIESRILAAKKRVWIYATNHQYVGEANSVANYLIEHKELDVRFLMLDPHSLFIDTRWAYIPGKTNASDFAVEISNNLSSLFSTYKKHKHISMKLFSRQPGFMLYLIDDTLIVSPILIQGRAREQEHFCFNLLYPSVSELANDYLEHFHRVWMESKQLSARQLKYDAAKKTRLLTIEKGVQIGLTSRIYVQLRHEEENRTGLASGTG